MKMKLFATILVVTIAMTMNTYAQRQSQNENLLDFSPDSLSKTIQWAKLIQQNSIVKINKQNLSDTKSLVWKWDTIVYYDTVGLAHRHIQTFNISGNILSQLIEQWQTNTWVNDDRITYTYDGNGNILTKLLEEWANNSWWNSTRDSYTYDGSGNILTNIREESQNNVWANYERLTYTYDGNGNLLTRFDEQWLNNTWVNDWKYYYNYDGNGNLLTRLSEQWLNNIWVNGYKSTYTYDGNGNVLTKLHESWQNNMWMNGNKSTYTYDGNENLLTCLFEGWQNNIWVKVNKLTYTYDGADNLITLLNEKWQNSTWVNLSNTTYTYNMADNSISGKYDAWNGNDNNWHPGMINGINVYSQKVPIYYSNLFDHRFEASFISFNSGIRGLNVESNRFSICPNPASDIVSFNIISRIVNEFTLKIYNVVGELVKSETLSQKQNKINICCLNNGIYIVEIKSKEWTGKQKLVIQK